jgi:tetratricopeptide (TPR) repeat protein
MAARAQGRAPPAEGTSFLGYPVSGEALYLARRYEEAVAAFAEVISLKPDYKGTCGFRGFAYYGLGDLQSARSSCETTPDYY